MIKEVHAVIYHMLVEKTTMHFIPTDGIGFPRASTNHNVDHPLYMGKLFIQLSLGVNNKAAQMVLLIKFQMDAV